MNPSTTLLVVSLFIAACATQEEPEPTCIPEVADSLDLYLAGPQQSVDTICAPCHQNNKSSMRLYPGQHEHNMETLIDRSRLEVDGVPLPLVKMSGGEGHGGGLIYPTDSEGYNAFELWLSVANGGEAPAELACEDGSSSGSIWDRVTVMSESQTVLRAYQEIAGIAPAEKLLGQIESGTVTLFDALVELLKNPAIEEWIKETEDRELHTRKYWMNGVDVISGERYPNKAFWNAGGYSEEEKQAWASCAQQAVGQEVVNTIWESIRKGRPYTELACTSIAVNPCSARSYGIPLSVFEDSEDLDAFVFMNPPDVPHGGGLLSSNMFATRWPTTPTNRSRNRSRYWWLYTQNVDILERGTRPVDVGAVGAFNPTLNEESCTTCHEDVDPVAQLFLLSWTDSGASQLTSDKWKPDMFEPGIGQGILLPYDERTRAMAWAGSQVCTDSALRDQFRAAAIRRYFTALTGTPVYPRPTDTSDPNYAARTKGVKQQEAFLVSLRSLMEDKNDDIRFVIIEILMSPWYRATGITGEVSEEEAVELSVLGSPCTRDPRSLDRVMRSLGFAWTDQNGTAYLTSSKHYLFYAGGADSDQILTPLCDTNGFRALIEDRLGHEFSCRVTAQDFELPKDERIFFPHVEIDDIPAYKGEPIPGMVLKIQDNLQHLARVFHRRVLTAPELSVWTDFAIAVQAACLADMAKGEWSENIPGPCQSETIKKDPQCVLMMWRVLLDAMIMDPALTYGVKP